MESASKASDWYIFAPMALSTDLVDIQRQARLFFEADVRCEYALSESESSLRRTVRVCHVNPSKIGSKSIDMCLREASFCVSVEQVPSVYVSMFMDAAHQAVSRMGGQGFELLLDRTRYVYRVASSDDDAEHHMAAMVVAGACSSVLLAPVLWPGWQQISGVRGIKTELLKIGWL